MRGGTNHGTNSIFMQRRQYFISTSRIIIAEIEEGKWQWMIADIDAPSIGGCGQNIKDWLHFKRA